MRVLEQRLPVGNFAREIRRIVLEQSKRAHVGHIGSALSIAEILAVLYGEVLRVTDLKDDDRDRFILSKGHAALALYACLYLREWIDAEQLATFCEDGSLLGVHPEHGLTGVEFSTGSLGHGLPVAAGMAVAARHQERSSRTFVLVSDAECNEGSVWEAVMFAAHHQLSNLVVIVDNNGQQALGYTEDVLSLTPLQERWEAFGWHAPVVDGHDTAELQKVLGTPADDDRPTAVIATTVFGKGVSFMERQIPWHYLPMTDEEFNAAMHEVGQS